MSRRRICVVTGSRAEYGLLSGLMREIQADSRLELALVCTGMHLSPEHGMTVHQIEEDGFKIAARIDMKLSGDSPADVTRSMGEALIGFARYFESSKNDMVVVLGDRFEILAAAQAAMMARIPIAHIHGGETTEGAIDESIRHAITKMAQLHFVSAEPHRRRVIQLGENPENVLNVGAPGLDAIRTTLFLSREELEKELGFRLGARNFLVTFHPETLALGGQPALPISPLCEALDRFPDAHVIFTSPNADAGGRVIAAAIEEYAGKNPGRVKVVASLGQRRYLSLVREVDAVVGNSSSGLIEVPALRRPTVNIGDRQKGRLRGETVLDCANTASAILAAIEQALSPEFARTLCTAESPYGSGHASRRIKNLLADADLPRLLRKPFYDVSIALPSKAVRTVVIAEAGVNHNGDLGMATRLIDVAAEAGADYVKFQSFKSEKLVTDAAPKADYQKKQTQSGESQLAMLKKLELSADDHVKLAAHCKKRGIKFLSTPFDEESLEMLVSEFAIPFVKIPSGELTNAPFLLKIADQGKPVVLSTGMATLAEVRLALAVLAYGFTVPAKERIKNPPGLDAFDAAFYSAPGRSALKNSVTVLHCTTEYPCPLDEVNLRAMEALSEAFDLPVGYSDHTAGVNIAIAAAARGAVLIEKHFTLDRALPGPDHKASLEPDELKTMVQAIREVEVSRGGGGKAPSASERKNTAIARKSLVAARAIRQGERFTPENLTTKRPGSGIAPVCYWQWLGQTAARDYKSNELIVEDHDSK